MPKPKKIAYSFLINDLFHYGHLKMLEAARANSDYHICGVISDSVVEKWISPKICSYEERKRVIQGLRCVDEVICQDSMDPTENLAKIHQQYPDAAIVLAQNHHLWESVLGSNFIQQINGEIIEHDFYPNLSRENISKAFVSSFLEKRSFEGTAFNDLKLGNINHYRDKFSTKANTLRELKGFLKHAMIEEEFIFTVGQWEKDENEIIQTIIGIFGDAKLIIRSSSLNEDSLSYSNAGHYRSVLGVKPGILDIKNSVNAVINSYRSDHSFDESNQVLIQRQTGSVAVSGVVFTRNIWNSTPYYLINFDEGNQATDTVTGGIAGNKVEIFREIAIEDAPEKWRAVLKAVREIEEFFKGVALDIEFAVRNDGKVVIFQVRPLAANSRFDSIDDDLIMKKIKSCVEAYSKLTKGGEFLVDEVFLSDMAFWNPAELIGDRPNFLDNSLFNHLIMKNCWNEALIPIGYSKISRNLQIIIGGKPYINVHDAFLCLLPESLLLDMKKRLLGQYFSKLKSQPSLHDKIEFEIVHNCYRFDFHLTQEELLENGFSSKDVSILKQTLLSLTNGILAGFKSTVCDDGKSIDLMEIHFREILQEVSNTENLSMKLDLVYRLIEDCMRFGIPPFVRAARFAFIGSAILKSMALAGIVVQEEIDEFMSSIRTVASEMDEDLQGLRCGRIDAEDFVEKYGHLRPGTYDITKLPYSKNPSCISADIPGRKPECDHIVKAEHRVNKEMIRLISNACRLHGVQADGNSLLGFIRQSIELREYFKFVYTRNISLALEIIADAGGSLGFSREELANLDYYSIVNYRESCTEDEIYGIWKSLIKSRKEDKRINDLLSLPPLVFSEKDFIAVPYYSAVPNFITCSLVEGDLIFIDKEALDTEIIDKVVVIEKADPGYDWIFTKRIKALLTKYGGAASHMAIRCSEFAIPAAIGCGDLLFSRIMKSSRVVLDCGKKTINLI
jgi:glutamine kinase